MEKSRIGVVGLGVMGANLALNIAEKGHLVSVYDSNADATQHFLEKAGDLSGRTVPSQDLGAFVQSMTTPRAVIVLVPAGGAVDAVVESLKTVLEPGDMIIDAGNSNFRNTREREAALRDTGLKFFGMGVSGGAEGARKGPSMMIGGDKASYEEIKDILEAIAAKHEGAPCVDHFGPDGAGHFVKTVHNGIEYADMQLISEVYGLLRDGAGRTPSDIGALFEAWDAGVLKSYLIEISGKVLQTTDAATGEPLVDVIVDMAGQKGTGRWTAIEAITLGQSPSTIEAAVAARSWSSMKDTREKGEEIFGDLATPENELTLSDEELEKALLVAKIIAYDQGFSLLRAASEEFEWKMDLSKCAEVWREGCIIRSALLDEMASAIREGLPKGQLIFAPRFASMVREGSAALRKCVAQAALLGLPVPAFANALTYFDTLRQGRGAANLVQGQRDYFGAHGFERTDGGSGHHGPWFR